MDQLSLSDLCECLSREIGQRERVYPRLQNMPEGQKAREIAMMKECLRVIESLRGVKARLRVSGVVEGYTAVLADRGCASEEELREVIVADIMKAIKG